MKKCFLFLVLFVCGLITATPEEQIFWGSDVPKGWNGSWADKFLTAPEKTNFSRTTSSNEILEFINVLRWNSECVHVIDMFTTSLGRVGTAVVMANPRVTTPEEAKASGKPVVYLQGDIHAGGESEPKEAILMLMRDILLGNKKYLLDDLIIISAPCINPDGNDTLRLWTHGEGDPHIGGTPRNAQGLNLNRDAIKLESIEINGLYRTIFNPWDPVLIYDGHGLSGWWAHAIGYVTSNVPAVHPGPRDYIFNTVFPALRESVRKNFGLEVFTYGDFDNLRTPKMEPTAFGPEYGYWTTEAKFVAAAYGLRNRMSILAETGSRAGNPSFERRIYVHYALISEILNYSAKHGKEMVKICQDADNDVVNKVLSRAESGQLKNYVEGKYESLGKIDLPAYKEIEVHYLPGTSVLASVPPGGLGPPDVVYTVEYLAKPVGTREATVPRGYFFPADMDFIADKLQTHNVKVDVLENSVTATGEEFVIDKIVKLPPSRGGGPIIKLEGGFRKSSVKKFPAGTFHVDMAQPMANMAFYCLEPQAADGFVGWGVLNSYLKSLGADKRSVVYPIYKYFKILE